MIIHALACWKLPTIIMARRFYIYWSPIRQSVRPSVVCLFVQICSSSKPFSLLRFFFLLSHYLIEVAGSVEQQIRAQWVFARKLKSIRYGVLFQRFMITCDGKLKWQNQDIAVLLCEISIEVTRKKKKTNWIETHLSCSPIIYGSSLHSRGFHVFKINSRKVLSN